MMWRIRNFKSFIMIRKYGSYMPIDQVRICNAQNTCIDVRGDNARILIIGILVVLMAMAMYYAKRA